MHTLTTGEGIWRGTPLKAGFTLRPGPAPAVPAAERDRVQARNAAVDQLWAEALVARPSLFDGRILVLDALDETAAHGHWCGFRHAYAQLRWPDLFDPPLRALAVNGVVVTADACVLLARRQARALYLPGGWQTPPAGSIEDRGDGTATLMEQLAAEAEEELQIAPDHLHTPVPLLAIEHPRTHVVDLGVMVGCTQTADTILTRFAQAAEDEYDRLEAIPVAGLGDLLASDRPLLPTARMLLHAARERLN